LNTNKVFGITTLDVLRSNTFVAAAAGLSPKDVAVPVVGGHSGNTILPLISQCVPPVQLTDNTIAALTDRIQNAGTEVVDAKGGAGSATLSMAQAASRFGSALIKAASGGRVVEYAFVPTNIVPNCDYFAASVVIGPTGTEEVRPLGKLSPFEEKKLAEALPALQSNISTGKAFVSKL
jgi:malate dehydrogenase